jgi:hypothetical protein
VVFFFVFVHLPDRNSQLGFGAAFHKFEQHECEDINSARGVLENAKVALRWGKDSLATLSPLSCTQVPQYWDQARSFVVDESLVAQQKRAL